MDKSKKIIILVGVIFVICLSIVFGYNFIKEDNNNNNINAEINNNKVENGKVENGKVENGKIENNKLYDESDLEFKNIEIGSNLANELVDFIPKHFFLYANANDEEYMIYSALNNLKEQDSNYHIENVYKAFKKQTVENEVKRLFGDDAVVTKTKFNNYPIIYDENNSLYAIISSGFGDLEERYEVKEIKENVDEFNISLYLVILKYDEENNAFLYTKNSEEPKKIENNENGIDTSNIINLYKDELPVIYYKLHKNDKRGTSYYIEDICFILRSANEVNKDGRH